MFNRCIISKFSSVGKFVRGFETSVTLQVLWARVREALNTTIPEKNPRKPCWIRTAGGLRTLAVTSQPPPTLLNTPTWFFFTFFKLYKWYQIAQHTTFSNLCNHCYKSTWSFTHTFTSKNNTCGIVSKTYEHRLLILITN